MSSISFTIEVAYIQSVNKLHTPVIRWIINRKNTFHKMMKCIPKKLPKPDIILSTEARVARLNYFRALNKLGPLPKDHGFKFKNIDITIGAYFKTLYSKRDIDNALKIFIDVLAAHFKFNDSNIVNIHTYKRELTGNSPKEYIHVKMVSMVKTDEELKVSAEDMKSISGVLTVNG